MSRNERIALYASLALNIFFAGAAAILIGGFLLHGPRFHGPGPFPPHPNGGFLARILPEATLKRLEPTLDPQRKLAHAAFDDARASRRAAVEKLAAQPYSNEATKEAFQKARDADMKAVAAAQELMAQALLSLNDDERLEVYKRLSAMTDARDAKWRDKGPPGMIGDGPGPGGDAPPPPPPGQ